MTTSTPKRGGRRPKDRDELRADLRKRYHALFLAYSKFDSSDPKCVGEFRRAVISAAAFTLKHRAKLEAEHGSA